ncbi:hypothetical protein FACS1894216_21240 [Synergistales bacterium]|nr:hypothetical protein FACS1894216_21240 [Synergistales bacterium]
MTISASDIINKLSEMASDDYAKEARRGVIGIETLTLLGIPHSELVALAEGFGNGAPMRDIASELAAHDNYEARLLSYMLMDVSLFTEADADETARGLDSFVVREYCCRNLLSKLPFAARKALEWANSDDRVMTCSGFSLISAIVRNMPEDSPDETGLCDYSLFLLRKRASEDSGDIMKAVASCLVSIGRRSSAWLEAAIETAEEISAQPSPNAKWVASQSIGILKSSRMKRGKE